jgi:hypothetical protein
VSKLDNLISFETQGKADFDRDEIKDNGENLKETKLVNFYSLVGINFGNIASNDAVIAAKINSIVKEGWTRSPL